MDNIHKREITKELQESYLDYAMSVIVARALPDVRDGLKPVHRRILWSMWDSGLTYLAKTRKSANVVGECFVKDTLVATTRGLRPIQDIEIGDTVFTHTGAKGVTMKYCMPPRPLKKITLSKVTESRAVKSSRLLKLICLFLSLVGIGLRPIEIISGYFSRIIGPRKPLPPNSTV